MAQITCKAKNGYEKLQIHPKYTTVTSSKHNHKPRVIKNFDNRVFVFENLMIPIEVPARKTKTGAQKWVIHRVRKSKTEVSLKLVALTPCDTPI